MSLSFPSLTKSHLSTNLSLSDCLALLLSLLAVGIAYLVSERIYEGMPHIEDEIALVWQARVMADGQLSLPSPAHPRSFLVPFVVDYNGQRFGKYPLGWPALLSAGIRLGARGMVNPLLAGLGLWLTYCLGKKVWGEIVGLLAALLTVFSPYFVLNSATLLTHPLGLVLSTAFALSWMDILDQSYSSRKIVASLTAGATLGALALTRPFTALAIGVPFAFHAIYLLIKSTWQVRKHIIIVGCLAIGLASLTFIWQYDLTGHPFLNPYTLWWQYDKPGFGVGYGVTKEGHTIAQAMINTRFSLWVGYNDLFGWGSYSWIFLPVGLIAVFIKRNWRGALVGSVIASLILIYAAYWVSSWLYGPRYFYEGLYSCTLLSAVGIAFLAGFPIKPNEGLKSMLGWHRLRRLLVVAILTFLISLNLAYYLPMRLEGMRNLYGMQTSDLQPFQAAQSQGLTPALVIVHANHWTDYGVFLELADPDLSSPFIFARSRGLMADAALSAEFPDRKIFHYYPEEPYTFYLKLRP